MHLIGWLSLGCLVVFFLELWSVLSFRSFFLSWRTCYVKGRSLRCSLGRGNAGGCAVMLSVGEGPRGSNGACSTLSRISVTAYATHNQIGLFWCWFLSGWACACSRPLWVSPTISPVRLGVSPAAASTPTGVFTQRFEALFPWAGALGCVVCFTPPLFLPVYLCRNVGPQGLPATTLWGLLAATWPAPFNNLPPHWVRQPPACLKSSLPQLPISAPPTGLDDCFFFIFLVAGLPYSSIFCQFWLFFVFKFLLSFWLWDEAQCVYLCLHLGRKLQHRIKFKKLSNVCINISYSY